MAYQQTPVIGLVGGVGCGKSAVARRLAERLRTRMIDADAVGHAVLLRDDVKSQLHALFGDEVLGDGQIDRAAVARLVFGDTKEHAAARSKLEAIVHPVMRDLFEEEFRSARKADDVDLIVFDAAVLLESGWRDAVDVVAYVDVPAIERMRRVSASRGWSEQELLRREASQWPLERKRAAADLVIDNSGSIDAAVQQLESDLHKRGHFSPTNTDRPIRQATGQPISSSAHQLVNESQTNDTNF